MDRVRGPHHGETKMRKSMAVHSNPTPATVSSHVVSLHLCSHLQSGIMAAILALGLRNSTNNKH